MAALLGLVLALLSLGMEQGKVVVRTGVPGAKFYLDGNFVDLTDANGNLKMEGFPSGSFRYSVRKEGYHAADGSFTIAEGEAKTIEVTLKPVEGPRKTSNPSPRTQAARREEKAATRTAAPADATPSAPPAFVTEAKPTSPPVQHPVQRHVEEYSSPVVWLLGVVLAIGTALALTVWNLRQKKNRLKPGLPFEAPILSTDEPLAEGAPQTSATAPPEFLEELKRREEMMKAGIVETRPREMDRMKQREKEIVIVLPKEAYRIEEEK